MIKPSFWSTSVHIKAAGISEGLHGDQSGATYEAVRDWASLSAQLVAKGPISDSRHPPPLTLGLGEKARTMRVSDNTVLQSLMGS